MLWKDKTRQYSTMPLSLSFSAVWLLVQSKSTLASPSSEHCKIQAESQPKEFQVCGHVSTKPISISTTACIPTGIQSVDSELWVTIIFLLWYWLISNLFSETPLIIFYNFQKFREMLKAKKNIFENSYF